MSTPSSRDSSPMLISRKTTRISSPSRRFQDYDDLTRSPPAKQNRTQKHHSSSRTVQIQRALASSPDSSPPRSASRSCSTTRTPKLKEKRREKRREPFARHPGIEPRAPNAFRIADMASARLEQKTIDDLKREVQAEVFDPVAVGKLLSNGYERDTIMSQAVQSLQESTTRKVIDLRYLNDKLSTPCDSDTLKNALLGIAFNNNCISPSASGSEKIQSELHNVIRHIKRKSFLPAFDKSKPLETRHFASETDFTKFYDLNKFYAGYTIANEAREKQLKRLVRDVLETITKGLVNLWKMSYCETKEGRAASSKFAVFPVSLIRELEGFLLDSMHIHLPLEFVSLPPDQWTGEYRYSSDFGETVDEQRRELKKRQLARTDALRDIRDAVSSALQHYRGNKHYHLLSKTFITCKCSGVNKIKHHVSWKDIERNEYKIRDGDLMEVRDDVENEPEPVLTDQATVSAAAAPTASPH